MFGFLTILLNFLIPLIITVKELVSNCFVLVLLGLDGLVLGALAVLLDLGKLRRECKVFLFFVLCIVTNLDITFLVKVV